MKTPWCSYAVALVLPYGSTGVDGQAAVPAWPAFRGPNGSGVGTDGRPPVRPGPTNAVVWKVAMPFSPSSPVPADGRIYVASVSGKLAVVKAGGEKPEVLHQAEFGERIPATPALAGDRLYLRTRTALYAFGSESAR